jgi:predicted GIY-YIG superfamily endonuclease
MTAPTTVETGTVYLLHFPEAHPSGARHYIGWSTDPLKRLEAHRNGRGSRLTVWMFRAKKPIELVRTWEGKTRGDERRMKRRHQAARLCPMCRPAALARHAERERKVSKTKAAVLVHKEQTDG